MDVTARKLSDRSDCQKVAKMFIFIITSLNDDIINFHQRCGYHGFIQLIGHDDKLRDGRNKLDPPALRPAQDQSDRSDRRRESNQKRIQNGHLSSHDVLRSDYTQQDWIATDLAIYRDTSNAIIGSCEGA